MIIPQLKGKRYIALVRCSTKGQADTSPEEQLAYIRAFAEENGLEFVDTIELAGIPATKPAKLKHFAQIIARKKIRNDFNCVVVYDWSRFTRCGPVHRHYVEYMLRYEGVVVVSATSKLPPGHLGDAIGSFDDWMNHEQMRTHARNVVIGRQKALEDGRVPISQVTPYALDRRISTMDGQPLFYLRNLPDGSQIRFDKDHKTVLQRYPSNKGADGNVHYRKQKFERSRFVLGEKAAVENVRWMFRQHYLMHWGFGRITHGLNGRGIPSPSGSRWSPDSVKYILGNPIYLGLGVGNRMARSQFYEPAQHRPKEVEVDFQVLATHENLPLRRREKKEWFERKEEPLGELITGKVRELAEVAIGRILEEFALHVPRRTAPEGRLLSPYILTGILRSTDPDDFMSGRQMGKKERRYTVTRTPLLKGTKKSVKAELVEEKALEVLTPVCSDRSAIETAVLSFFNRKRKEQAVNRADDLKAERKALKERLEKILGMGTESQRLFEDEMDMIEKRLTSIAAEQSEDDVPSETEAREIARSIAEQLEEGAKAIRSLPPASVTSLLRTLFKEFRIDLKYNTLKVVMGVPGWVLMNADARKDVMCVSQNLASYPLPYAHQREWAIFGWISRIDLRFRAAA